MLFDRIVDQCSCSETMDMTILFFSAVLDKVNVSAIAYVYAHCRSAAEFMIMLIIEIRPEFYFMNMIPA